MPGTNLIKIQGKVKAGKIDCLLVTSPMDLLYLTGVDIQGGYWAVITAGKAFIITSKMLCKQISDLTANAGFEVIESKKFSLTLKSILKAVGIKNLSVDPGKITWEIKQKLDKSIGKNRIKPVSGFFESLRQVKDENEIRLIKESCAIAAKVFNAVKKEVKPGITEIQIGNRIMELLYKNGVEPSFTPIVASGPRASYPHHVNSANKLNKNDLIIIDMGAKYKGYCSDLTRTIILGKINTFNRRIFSLVKRAQAKGIAAARPGVKSISVDKTVRACIKNAGYGSNFLHSTGHGIGLEVHESPSISAAGKVVLKPGMVITVEPGVYIENNFGVRIEDTVLITKNGREVLTSDAK
ncbi:MAG: hypothetical protein A2297_02940 [Elusimicrobia bacterium RIFOXYB2_FULL_48_7]|nr:MAG: hypothetical protein A2297_02940 [Elusimicrobia bacterium RIFOXYB2_FULL_48_7]